MSRSRVSGRLAPLALAAAVAIVLLAAVNSQASGSPHPSYRAKSGHKCRAGYVRRVRHAKRREHGKTVKVRQVWCVYKPTSTTHTTTPTPITPAPTPTYVSVSASFGCGSSCDFLISDALGYTDSSGTARQLPQQSITFTIIDNATGATVGSFIGSSDADFDCELGYTVDESAHTQTFYGQAVGTVPACPLPSPVTMPSADLAQLGGAFAGDSQYAASTATPQAL